MTKILNVVGARPNFMKIAPVVEALKGREDKFSSLLVHTGQHYDAAMSRAFFDDLGLPRPDVDLGVGSGSHAEQTAKIMMKFEKVCIAERPDLVIVVGDVNSTIACALTAKKLGIDVAHVEAGLRSRDMTMPEEINRICTDAISDFLFTTDRLADENLLSEGIAATRIHFVGNVMIDTLMKHRDGAAALDLSERLGLKGRSFATLTLHRPSNVDDPDTLRGILGALTEIAETLPIVFPVHPRTRERLQKFGLADLLADDMPVRGIWACEPMGYLEFLHLNANAALVLTDSGGLQEETTVLGVPCITIRPNTERPITCSQGTNRVVGGAPEAIVKAVHEALDADRKEARVPEKWDGETAQRIMDVLVRAYA